MDVTEILKACQSPDATARQLGEAKLREVESDPAIFFQALSSHIATPTNPADTRKLSGMCSLRSASLPDVIPASFSRLCAVLLRMHRSGFEKCTGFSR
jgi:hypothetical protein